MTDTVTIVPGDIDTTIAVCVLEDMLNEINEYFIVELFNPMYVTLADSIGVATITDNDDPPTIFIGDTCVVEGTMGDSTRAYFKVSLSNPSGKTVTVEYETVNSTAKADTDYVHVTGTLTLPEGVVCDSTTICVPILGDNLGEPEEFFFVRLSSAMCATMGDSVGLGKIDDDVRCPRFLYQIS